MRLKHPLLALSVIYFGSRILLLALAGLFLIRSGFLKHNWDQNLHLERSPSVWIEALYRWDACWYVEIAEYGYTASRGHVEDRKFTTVPFSAGFFPLFPYAIRALRPILGSYELAGIIAGLLGGWTAILAFFLLARSALEAEDAFRSTLVLLAFPPSIFLSLPFSEGLFLGLVCLGFLSLERRLGEGLPAFTLAVLARPLGLFLPICFVIGRRPWAERLKAAAAWGLGIALLMLISYANLGGLEPFFQRQALSRGLTTGPWQAFLEFLGSTSKGWFSWKGGYLDLGLALFALLTLGLGTRRRMLPGPWLAWGWIAVLVPLCSSLLSFQRLLLPAFPLFILWSLLVPRRLFPAVLALLGSAQIYYVFRYATFQWIA